MADNYTPTTQDVRDGYTTTMKGRAEFDRWLAADRAEVAAQARAGERERIAAAIEARRSTGLIADGITQYTEGVRDGFTAAARIARTPDPNGDNT